MQSVKVYTVTAEGIKQEKRRALSRTLPIFALIIIPILLAMVILDSDNLLAMVIAAPMILLAFGAGIRRAMKLLDEKWSSYKLLVGPDLVIRKQVRLADLEVPRARIAKIEELSKWGIRIRLTDSPLIVEVPIGLNDYPQLRDHLANWATIETKSARRERGLQIVLVIGVIAAFIMIFLSQTLIVFIPAAIYLLAIMMWGLISLKRRPDIMSQSKMSFLRYVMATIMIAIMIIAKLSLILSK